MLRHVFTAFDLDNSGFIEPEELMRLGAARQQLGYRTRVWTEEKNTGLVNSLDTDQDGRVSAAEFVRGYNAMIEPDIDTFLRVATEFHEVYLTE